MATYSSLSAQDRLPLLPTRRLRFDFFTRRCDESRLLHTVRERWESKTPRLHPEAIFKYFRPTILSGTWCSSLCIYSTIVSSSNHGHVLVTDLTSSCPPMHAHTHTILVHPHLVFIPFTKNNILLDDLTSSRHLPRTSLFIAQTCIQTTGHKMAAFHLELKQPTVPPSAPSRRTQGRRNPNPTLEKGVNGLFFCVRAARSQLGCAVTHSWHINIFSQPLLSLLDLSFVRAERYSNCVACLLFMTTVSVFHLQIQQPLWADTVLSVFVDDSEVTVSVAGLSQHWTEWQIATVKNTWTTSSVQKPLEWAKSSITH